MKVFRIFEGSVFCFIFYNQVVFYKDVNWSVDSIILIFVENEEDGKDIYNF